MKKVCKYGLLALVVALSALVLVGCSSSKDKTSDNGGDATKEVRVFNVGVKQDVPKFGFLNTETGEFEGFEIDLAKAIGEKIAADENKTAEFKFTPVTPKTRGPLIDNGELDYIIATYTITPERKESYNFSEPYFTDYVQVMVKKDSGIKSFKDLDGKTIGVAQGATSKDALQAEADKLGIKVKFNEYATYPEINTALNSGRVDAFSVDGAILAGYLTDDTMLLPEKFSPQEYGVASKLSNTELADQINAAIAEMQADGSLEQLKTDWGLN